MKLQIINDDGSVRFDKEFKVTNREKLSDEEVDEYLDSMARALEIFIERGSEYGCENWKLPEFKEEDIPLAALQNATTTYIKSKRVVNSLLNFAKSKDPKDLNYSVDNSVDVANYGHFTHIIVVALSKKYRKEKI